MGATKIYFHASRMPFVGLENFSSQQAFISRNMVFLYKKHVFMKKKTIDNNRYFMKTKIDGLDNYS